MEPWTTEEIAAIEKIIERYLENNRELIIKRLFGNKLLEMQTSKVRESMTEDASGNGKIIFERLA